MDSMFWVYVTVGLIFVTVAVAIKSIYYTSNVRQKYSWTLYSLVIASVCLVNLLVIQRFFNQLGLFQTHGSIILFCTYAPYALWAFSLYFLRNTAQAMHKQDFHKTHFSSIYAFNMILLAVMIPLAHIFFAYVNSVIHPLSNQLMLI